MLIRSDVVTDLDELKVVVGLASRLGGLLGLSGTGWNLGRSWDLSRAGHGVGVVVGGGGGWASGSS